MIANPCDAEGFFFTTENTEDTERENEKDAIHIGRTFPLNLVDAALSHGDAIPQTDHPV